MRILIWLSLLVAIVGVSQIAQAFQDKYRCTTTTENSVEYKGLVRAEKITKICETL